MGEGSAPWFTQATNVLYAIILPGSLFVSIFYFGVIYSGPGFDFLDDFGIHLLNTVLMLVDAIINAQRLRFWWILYTLAYGVLYVIFNYALFAADFRNIPEQCACDPPVEGCRPDGSCNFVYAALNWNMPEAAGQIVVASIVVGLPIVYTFYWLIEGISIPICARRAGKDTSQTCCQALCESICSSPSPNTGADWVHQFADSIFGASSLAFLIVRIVFFVIWAAIVVSHFSLNVQGGLWFIYLTNWSQAVELVYFAMALFTTFKARQASRSAEFTTSRM